MKRALAACVAYLLIGLPSIAQVRIYFDAENAPLMQERDGKAAGLYPALVAEAFKRMGVPLEMKAMSWIRVLDGCDRGMNGAGGLYANSPRLVKWDFSRPIFQERLAIYARKGTGFKYGSIADFRGKRIGVHAGWSYGDEFDIAAANQTLIRDDAATDEDNLRKLAAGQVDAVIANPDGADALLSKAGLSASVEKLPDLFSTVPVYIAFSKPANMRDLLARFDTTMAAMREDGTHARIVASILGK